MSSEDRQAAALERIADALERISPAPQTIPAFAASDGYVWRTEPNRLDPTEVSRVPLRLLLGVDRAKATIDGQHAPVRRRPAGEQRASLGRAGHG